MAKKNPYAKSEKNLYKQYQQDRDAKVQNYDPKDTGWTGFDNGDTTDNLKEKYGVIEISNVRGNEAGPLKFKAFITDYSESFESNWNSTEVFGRMDPIWTFQNTKRTIRLAFDVPSFSNSEGSKNLEKVSKIIRMMYPTYEKVQGTSIISESPVFTLRFENLICRSTDGGPLKGIIPSFDFAPDVQQGFYKGAGKIVPKTLKVSIDFNVLHDHEVGYNEHGSFLAAGDKFPYLGKGITSNESSTPKESPGVLNASAKPGSVAEKTKNAQQKKALT